MNQAVQCEEVRRIRRKLQLNQAELAAKLGVSPVTVSRWETGDRSCRGVHAMRLCALIQPSPTPGSTALTHIRTEEVTHLSDRDSVELFRNLLHCEARRHQISLDKITISVSTNVADGGIDAHVDFDIESGLIEKGSSIYQIKTGDTFKPWQPAEIEKELLDKTGKLKPAISAAMNTGSRYVLVCFGHSLLPKQKTDAEELLRKHLRTAKNKKPRVAVWGADQLIGWIAENPSLALRVARRDQSKCRTLDEWKLDELMKLPLMLGELQKQLIDQIREHMRSTHVHHVRIIGEPGLGKSRLILEALSAPDLASLVIYAEQAEDFLNDAFFRDFLRSDSAHQAIVVVDDCDSKNTASIWRALKSRAPRIRLITIGHSPDDTHDNHTALLDLGLSPLSQEDMTRIIRGYGVSEFEARQWASECGNYPRLAHAIGENLRGSPSDLLRPPTTVTDIWERFIAKKHHLGSETANRRMTVMCCVALFGRFGNRDPVKEEREFLAKLAHEIDSAITPPIFSELVEEFTRERILQGKTTLRLVPSLLGRWLWRTFWDRYGNVFSFDDLLMRMPESMQSWFISNMKDAHLSETAADKLKCLLERDGLVEQRMVNDSRENGNLIEVLSQSLPEETLDFLERTVGQCSCEKRLTILNGRFGIVSALAEIATHRQYFRRAARLLLDLAEAENQNYSNNATGTFISLFNLTIGMNCTSASPEERLPLLREVMDSTLTVRRSIALQACREALRWDHIRFSHGWRLDLRPAMEMWHPSLWGDLFKAYREIWALLKRTHQTAPSNERTAIANVLVETTVRLSVNFHSLADEIASMLEWLAFEPDTDIQKVVRSIHHVVRYPQHYEPKFVDRMRSLDLKIAGDSFASRFERHIMISDSGEWHTSESEGQVKLAKFMGDFVSQALNSPAELLAMLPDLVCRWGTQLYAFASELGERDTKSAFLEPTVNAFRVAGQLAEAQFFGCYLQGFARRDRKMVDNVILSLLDEAGDKSRIIQLITCAGWSSALLNRINQMVDDQQVSIAEISINFGYGHSITNLDEGAVQGFVERFLNANEGRVLEPALRIVDDYYLDNQHGHPLPCELTLALLSHKSLWDDSSGSMLDYHWAEVATAFAAQHPTLELQLLESMLRQCADWRIGIRIAVRTINSFLRGIIKRQPAASWHLISTLLTDSASSLASGVMRLLGPNMEWQPSGDNVHMISLFPQSMVLDWTSGDPDVRAPLLAIAAPCTFDPAQGGSLTREIVHRFARIEGVTGQLFSNFWSGSFSGNASDHYRKKRDRANQWLAAESSPAVQAWLDAYIRDLSNSIKREEITEERELWHS